MWVFRNSTSLLVIADLRSYSDLRHHPLFPNTFWSTKSRELQMKSSVEWKNMNNTFFPAEQWWRSSTPFIVNKCWKQQLSKKNWEGLHKMAKIEWVPIVFNTWNVRGNSMETYLSCFWITLSNFSCMEAAADVAGWGNPSRNERTSEKPVLTLGSTVHCNSSNSLRKA